MKFDRGLVPDGVTAIRLLYFLRVFLDLAIARQWKLPDDMEAWEFIERVDQLRAHRQERSARLRP